MLTKEIIAKYYRSNANGASLSKGRELFQKERVKFSKSSVDNIFRFEVAGSIVYDVVVEDNYNRIKTLCNCPYNYSGICKHSVAALMYLENSLDSLVEKAKTKSILKKTEVIKTHSTKDWFAFADLELLPQSKLTEILAVETVNRIANLHLSSRNFAINEFSGGEISYNFSYNWNYNRVFFSNSDNKLNTKCSCNSRVMGLCEHQAATFIYLFQNNGSDFFKILKPGYIEELIQQTTINFGLPKEFEFKEYFKIIFNGKDIVAEATKKGSTLVSIKELTSKSNENSAFAYLFKNDLALDFAAPTKQNSGLEIGYLFRFPTSDTLGVDGRFDFIAIIGKPDKTENSLSTGIKEYSEIGRDIQISLTPEDEQLIRLSKNTEFELSEKFISKINRAKDESNSEVLAYIKYYINIFNDIIPLLKNIKYLYISYEFHISRNTIEKITIAETQPEIHYKLTSDANFIKLKAYLKLDNEIIALNSSKITYLNLIFIEYANKLYYISNVKTALTISSIFENDKIEAPIAYAEDFFDKYVTPLSGFFTVEIKTPLFKIQNIEPKTMKKQIYISEMNTFVLFTPVVEYDDGVLINVLKESTELKRNDKKVKVIKRNTEFEQDFNKLLKSTHTSFVKQFPQEFYHLDFNSMIKGYWFHDAFETLRNAGIEIFGLDKLKNFKYSTHKAKISVNISSGQDWFDVHAEVKFGDFDVSLNDIKKALLRKENFVLLGDGSRGILPDEWITKFEQYFRHGQIKKDEIKLSKLKFSLIDELFDEKSYLDIIDEIREKKNKLKNFEEIKTLKIPKQITANLRDYQKFGFNWLNFLDEFGWGGILADDMGLGKTLQVLTFLQSRVNKSSKPNLIVVPTTLLFNWENEINKFAPEMTALFHYGANREKDHKNFSNYNLVFTTYGHLMNDIEHFGKQKFNYVILDESQAIKNPDSKRFKAVCLLNAHNKIAMTGTPIENNTFDLYSQMEFVNPGFLGSQAQFKENYSNPIDKDGDSERASELQRIITPFILRRTKEQVAKELPEKTEDIIYCEMDSEQRKVYEAFRNKYRDFLLNKIEEDGLGKSAIYIIEGLTKLRQICDSPKLLPGDEDYGDSSIKIKELIRHIKEKTSNHKILVFSQFVKMLKLIETQIKKEKIQYEYLDGQDKKDKRQESVENFQNNADVRVFLISLKAGGTGLNLTEADYVYIVDPWWNPAVENQAIDRTHRIGQEKKVIAYRMICKDTIEEKIMQHQAKKKKIASDIISTEEGFVKNLTKDDISALFD